MTPSTSASTRTAARTVAVVLAGGSGQRIGLATPKQLLKIAGKSILEHTLDIFERSTSVDEVIVMMNPGFVSDAEAIVRKAGLSKVSRVLPGGTSRNATTQLALDALAHYSAADTNVLFHDAVRPMLSQRVIDDCVTALGTYDAVDVAIPSSDTIIEVDDDIITDVPTRSRLRRGQTPQAFRMATIRDAYAKAWNDPRFEATDDCSVVLRYLPEVPIHVVAGEEQNMKVTQPVDIFIADKLFQLATSSTPEFTELDYTERLAGKTVVVFGGSYGIGAEVADLTEKHGARVFRYSRSATRTDVADPEDIAAALEQAHSATGRVDHVVNTAGVLRIGRLDRTSTAEIEEALKVNYLAPVNIARAAFPYLSQTGGQLLLYTSSSYTRGRGEYSLYSSSKAATVNLTQALADEWSEDGVRINCINPERTQTPMRTKAFGEEPSGTLLSADKVARTSVDVLLSDLTGHVIDVRREDLRALSVEIPGLEVEAAK
ncbi:bifunctional cytidylyltransferase/SDR family oxidoreductase [Nocardiopsis sp. MG754419]|uniref:bifunctional cytidylyltransferase/SDR family oxidoreductase n=1 Tax=Nocardiopsis sp. MG754419 TaxID=2259865 RepID=UPI0027DBFB41|nr:bifunctional cytidylyltransferase/SDR family oxidoreductase [Nocardiopsis sp. MG754419]MBR8743605.1 2-C-methyl-D-erythritol 4-phosphate cytidylyltransferase [Nocardiopsis sp. MG754419]